jgi:hypothetical protein
VERSVAPTPGGIGDVLELPVAKVAIKCIAAVHPAKVKITPAVAIDIAGSDTGPVQQDLVREMALFRKRVPEENSGACWREQ